MRKSLMSRLVGGGCALVLWWRLGSVMCVLADRMRRLVFFIYLVVLQTICFMSFFVLVLASPWNSLVANFT